MRKTKKKILKRDIKKKKAKVLNLDEEIDRLQKNDYSSLEVSHGFMTDGTLGGFKAAIDKMNHGFLTQFGLGLLAGMIIGLGYGAALSVTSQINDPNLAWVKTLLIGLIFPGAILLITFLGGGLFTSHSLATIPMFKGAVGQNRYWKSLAGVYLGNICGTGVLVLVLALTGVYNKAGVKGNSSFAFEAVDIGIHKLYNVGDAVVKDRSITAGDCFLTMLYVFASGLLCNLLVSATLPITSSTKSNGTASLVMLFAIAYFSLAGYQHSPANSFFFWSFVVDAALGSKNNVHSGTLALLFIPFNLIPALIGNWVGGGLVLPGILYLTQKKYVLTLFDELKLSRYIKIKKQTEIEIHRLEAIKKGKKPKNVSMKHISSNI